MAYSEPKEPADKQETNIGPQSAQAAYERYTTKRDPFLRRARDAAAITIPNLFPKEGQQTSDVEYPNQELGAHCVNTLGSKLGLILFPPNSAFFRMQPDPTALRELEAQDAGVTDEIEEALAEYENTIVREQEAQGLRPPTYTGFRLLVMTGNVLLYYPPEGGCKVYPLDRYVVCRDDVGNVLEIIAKDCISPLALPDEIRLQIEDFADPDRKDYIKQVEVYTRVKWNGDEWDLTQEIKGKVVKTGTYQKDKLPWLPLRMIPVPGEDYGRGMVEEYMGGFRKLDGLSDNIAKMAALGSKAVGLVSPNGITKVRDLNNAKNGDFVVGRPEDVKFLQIDKFNDLQTAAQTIERITGALSRAFLLNSSIQRDGERVTAEEIRYMAQELEDSNGGIYSLLAQEFQLKLVNIYIDRMERKGQLPKLPKGLVKPAIITGLAALGRNHEVERLRGFLSAVPPEILSQFGKWPEILKQLAIGFGVSAKKIIKTLEEIQQEQKQAQLAALTSSIGPNVVKAVGDNRKEQMKIDAQQPEQG